MQIRVAYDISVLANHFGRSAVQDGISRVAEELWLALAQRRDIDLAALSLCGEEPLLDSVKAYLYFNQHAKRVQGKFVDSFKGRFGLTRLYRQSFGACYLSELNGSTGHHNASILKRMTRGALYRLNYVYGADRVRKVFDPSNYDVFHSPFLRFPERGLTGGVPRVLTVYDLIPLVRPDFVADYHLPFFKSIIDEIDIKRDWVACISEFTKQEFCEYTGMSADRVGVTPLAASPLFHPVSDLERIGDIRTRYGIPDQPYLLTVAAPQPRKNLAHLVRCFARVLRENNLPELCLVFAGSSEQGWLQEKLFQEIEACPEFRSRITFTGYVRNEDLATLYSGAFAFVYPSLYEGFGLPPLEAMACGTPVIVSRATSLPEVVGDAGLLVDPQNEDELCGAILSLARDKELHTKLQQDGLEQAKRFSWSRCAEETVKIYHAALEES